MGEITCNINNCQQTYTNVHTWKSHVRRTACHREATGMGRRSLINPIAPTNENPPMDDSESDTADNIPQQGPTPQELYEDFRSRYQQTFFDFTVKMKEKYMLPNSVADRLTDDVQHLLESFQQNIYDIIKKQLVVNNDPLTLNFIFEDEDVFALMNQASKSAGAIGNALYSQYPLCEPIEMLLGHKENGKKDVGHYVPLVKMLKFILDQQDICSYIKSYASTRRIYCDDEKLYDLRYNHSEDEAVDIPLIFYMDEFEPANPIGSRKKIHKLTAIYYTIGTIPPQQRSELRSIFLWGLFYHSHVKKYGYEKILEPLVEDIKSLQEDNICLVSKDGSPLKFRSQLHLFTADNLSAHDLMGMQTNFNSGKFSRYCMADYDNINMLSDYTLCTLRTPEHHEQHLALLSSGTPQQQVRRDYGVVGRCVFSEIPNTDVLQLFPPDVMHDFMEGVVPVVTCVALADIIAKSNLNIQLLNNLLTNFKYGQCDNRNRYGAELTMTHIRSLSIPGTASEKLCLLRLLPIILSSILSSQIMENLEGVRLLHVCQDISDIVMAFVIDTVWLARLHSLIIDLHDIVNTLNPLAVKPKFHFLVHYPYLIRKYGPPRYYYTMRFESVHQYFKQLIGKTKNFINITLTLSTRFQRSRAYDLNQEKYFSVHHIPSGNAKPLSSLNHQLVSAITVSFPNIDENESIFVCNNAEIAGVSYRKKNIYIASLTGGYFEAPRFLQVIELVKVREAWLLHVQYLETVSFNELYHSYEVIISDPASYVQPTGSELDHTPLSIYTVNGQHLIPLRYKVTSHVSYLLYLSLWVIFILDRRKWQPQCFLSPMANINKKR